MRVRTIVLMARAFGTHAVRDMVKALEGDEEDLYTAQSSPLEAIAADEREHAAIWERLGAGGRAEATAAKPASEIAAGERRTGPASRGRSGRSSSVSPTGSSRIWPS